MLNRDSRFPRRPTVIRGRYSNGKAKNERLTLRPHGRKFPKSFFLVALVFFLATLFSASPTFFQRIGPMVETWLEDEPKSMDSRSDQVPDGRRKEGHLKPKRDAESTQGSALPATTGAGGVLTISIGEAFRSVGFVLPARSRKLLLSDRPDKLYKRLPGFAGGRQKFGRISLQGGQQYRFVLDMSDGGNSLYLDANRNGDLTDDGTPIRNAGKGLFANRIQFSLPKVTGIPQLSGDYELWVFSNSQSWQENSLRVYARTQLSGQLLLDGKRYRAYLADNHRLDADYTNDGIGIDLNGDGKIETVEYLPPGGEILVGGKRYGVKITP